MTDDNEHLNDDTQAEDSIGSPFITPKRIATGELFASRYRIISSLGHGGMGYVFKATDISLKRIVAIKVLRNAGSDREIQRFHQEATVIAQLDHPNIIRVFETSITDDDTPYIVMDFLDGHTLANELQQGRLSLQRALLILLQACDAIEHAHSKGIIHRDLKPSNLMIINNAGADQVKLLDFGLAKLRDDTGETVEQLTKTGEMFGTPQYMSPEQIACKPIDRRTDIYALGCIFYEMLAGVAPFRGQTTIETFMLHQSAEPAPIWKFRNDLPAERVQSVLVKMLAKSPEGRYENIAELRRALADIDKSDNALSKLSKRVSLVLNSKSAKIRFLKAASVIVLVSIAVLSGWAFFTVTAGLNWRNFDQDLFTSTWKELHYRGQVAFDKGDYPIARSLFEKALMKARMDSSNHRKSRLNTMAYELSMLSDVAKMPKPHLEYEIAKTIDTPAEFKELRQKLKRGEFEPTKENIKFIVDKIVVLRIFAGNNDPTLKDFLDRARALMNKAEQLPEIENLKLRVLEIENLNFNKASNIALEAELANCVNKLDEIAKTDRKLFLDWKWCCLEVELLTQRTRIKNEEERIDRLKQAEQYITSPVQKLILERYASVLIEQYEGINSAKISLEKAVHSFELSGEAPNIGLSHSLFMLAKIYLKEELPQQALPLLLRAEALAAGTPITSIEDVQIAIVEAYCDLHRYDEAIAQGNHLVDAMKRSFDPSSLELAKAYSILAYAHLEANQLDKAEMYLLDTLSITEQHPNSTAAVLSWRQALQNLCTLYKKKGDNKKYEEYTARLRDMEVRLDELRERYAKLTH